MRASYRRDFADSPSTMPSVFDSEQQLDRLTPAHLVAPHRDMSGILDAEDELDAEDLYLDLGVGD